MRYDSSVRIAIVPFGDLDPRKLHALRDRLQDLLRLRAEIVEAVKIPEESFVPSRNQYLAESFLLCLEEVPWDGYVRALGVTDRDLFAPGLNFVFGQAYGTVAVISTWRLRSCRGPENHDPLLEARMVKEAIHELGHTFGLGHCSDPFCVMHFSNSIRDTDLKSELFCDNCSAKVGERDGGEV